MSENQFRSNSLTRKELQPKSFFQRVIQHCEEENGRVWTTELEEQLFTPVKVKYAGDHNGSTRRAVFVKVSETNFSPATVVKPGVTVHFGRMSCNAFIRLLGKNFLNFPLRVV